MKAGHQQSDKDRSSQTLFGRLSITRRGIGQISCVAVLSVAACLASSSPIALRATPQNSEEATSQPEDVNADASTARVVGLKYNCVHVLKLEKTLKLYREILGFKLVGAEILHGKGIEGMLVMKLQANDCVVHLSLPAPKYRNTVGPIGNTNHNHFMFVVNDIVPICDKLKEEGYDLENEEYARDKYSFFTGPNGEIVGLTEYRD